MNVEEWEPIPDEFLRVAHCDWKVVSVVMRWTSTIGYPATGGDNAV